MPLAHRSATGESGAVQILEAQRGVWKHHPLLGITADATWKPRYKLRRKEKMSSRLVSLCPRSGLDSSEPSGNLRYTQRTSATQGPGASESSARQFQTHACQNSQTMKLGGKGDG